MNVEEGFEVIVERREECLTTNGIFLEAFIDVVIARERVVDIVVAVLVEAGETNSESFVNAATDSTFDFGGVVRPVCHVEISVELVSWCN